MIFFVKDTAINTLKTDLLVLTVDSKTAFKPKIKIFNSQTNGLLKKTIARDNFKGALGETIFFSHLPGVGRKSFTSWHWNQKASFKSVQEFDNTIVNKRLT